MPPPFENVETAGDCLIVTLDLPGAAKNAIHVEVGGRSLVVRAHIRQSDYYYLYRKELPAPVRSEGVHGQFQDDLLHLRLHKGEEPPNGEGRTPAPMRSPPPKTSTMKVGLAPPFENVVEDVDCVIVTLALPGATQGAISIEAQGRSVIIEAGIKNSHYFYQYKKRLSVPVRSVGCRGRFRRDFLELEFQRDRDAPSEAVVCPYCHDTIKDSACVFCSAWICNACGTVNEAIDTQCKVCGVSRPWVEEV